MLEPAGAPVPHKPPTQPNGQKGTFCKAAVRWEGRKYVKGMMACVCPAGVQWGLPSLDLGGGLEEPIRTQSTIISQSRSISQLPVPSFLKVRPPSAGPSVPSLFGETRARR